MITDDDHGLSPHTGPGHPAVTGGFIMLKHQAGRGTQEVSISRRKLKARQCEFPEPDGPAAGTADEPLRLAVFFGAFFPEDDTQGHSG
jgi:hypothetical protein